MQHRHFGAGAVTSLFNAVFIVEPAMRVYSPVTYAHSDASLFSQCQSSTRPFNLTMPQNMEFQGRRMGPCPKIDVPDVHSILPLFKATKT